MLEDRCTGLMYKIEQCLLTLKRLSTTEINCILSITDRSQLSFKHNKSIYTKYQVHTKYMP